MMLPRLARALIAGAVILASCPALAGPAPSFTDVHATSNSTSCTRRVTVGRWTPGMGPVAPFVAKHALRGSQGTLIALGVTDDGFWSTQDEIPDGCGAECATINLVFTRFSDGRSTYHPLWSDADRVVAEKHPETLSAQREQVITKRLWAYAGSVWPASKMRQDYALVTPAANGGDEATPAPYAGWLAGVVRGGRWSLRFSTTLTQTMCWCNSSWTSIARPSP